MKKFLGFIFIIFSFTGCQPKEWIYQEVKSDCPQFNSSLLKRVPENRFNGIEVQFLQGEFGNLGFLNVYFLQVPSGSVILQINEYQYSFMGIVMAGGQRILLPNAATEAIIQTLLSGQKVGVYLEGFSTELCPENFPKHYSKFNPYF